MTRRNAPAAIAALAVASPVLIGALYSTLSALGLVGVGARGFTLDRVVRVISASDTWRGIAWTFTTAGIATAIAVAIALVLALRLRSSRIGRAMAMLPIAVPH